MCSHFMHKEKTNNKIWGGLIKCSNIQQSNIVLIFMFFFLNPGNKAKDSVGTGEFEWNLNTLIVLWRTLCLIQWENVKIWE